MRTYPAPARWAPRAANTAAPVIPGEPPITQHAARHLWVSTGRAGIEASRSSGVTTAMVDRETSRPMSATVTRPVSHRPGDSTRPGFSAAKVRVSSADHGDPSSSPVRPCTPDGMSTASTNGDPCSAGGS